MFGAVVRLPGNRLQMPGRHRPGFAGLRTGARWGPRDWPAGVVARTIISVPPQDPELLRRLLRAKDRMDAASHEEWPVRRLARVSGVSEAHFARSFKEAFGIPPHRYLLTRRIERATALLRDTDLADHRDRLPDRLEQPGHVRAHVPRRHRREPGRAPGAREGRAARARARARLLPQRGSPARPHDRSFGEATAGGGRYEWVRRNGGPMSQGVGMVGLYVRDQDEAARVLRREARIPRPHRREERRLPLADGAAPGPAVVPARPVQAGVADRSTRRPRRRCARSWRRARCRRSC